MVSGVESNFWFRKNHQPAGPDGLQYLGDFAHSVPTSHLPRARFAISNIPPPAFNLVSDTASEVAAGVLACRGVVASRPADKTRGEKIVCVSENADAFFRAARCPPSTSGETPDATSAADFQPGFRRNNSGQAGKEEIPFQMPTELGRAGQPDNLLAHYENRSNHHRWLDRGRASRASGAKPNCPYLFSCRKRNPRSHQPATTFWQGWTFRRSHVCSIWLYGWRGRQSSVFD